MKKTKTNIGLIVGVVLACVLILYWLFTTTLIEETASFEPVNEIIE